MSSKTPLVLLAATAFANSLHLQERLQYWDCEFHLAASYAEAHDLLNRYEFDLVLSDANLSDGRAYRLIPWLTGSPTTLFIAFSGDGTCWWLPAVDRGQQSCGSQALRPSEFVRMLDKILYGLVSEPGREPTSSTQAVLPAGSLSTFETSIRVPERAAAMHEIQEMQARSTLDA